jgi:restriction system protein
MLFCELELPKLEETPDIKSFSIKSDGTMKCSHFPSREINKLYEKMIYSIIIRTINELFNLDYKNYIDIIVVNGKVKRINPATGIETDNCILSIQTNKTEFSKINPLQVDPHSCFKYLKGISGIDLSNYVPIKPILQLQHDKRTVDSYEVELSSITNLAAMNWEDFEHLIRALFEKEFSENGGEVKVTRASRDGGVDAIAFDPDPIKGGKIVIQAKRYTNIVGVSAVRDLYGTVLNEGANKGILVTTSDYGSDSYEFIKGKPLTLLNGNNLLYLLEKHGQKARIDIQEAKAFLKNMD